MSTKMAGLGGNSLRMSQTAAAAQPRNARPTKVNLLRRDHPGFLTAAVEDHRSLAAPNFKAMRVLGTGRKSWPLWPKLCAVSELAAWANWQKGGREWLAADLRDSVGNGGFGPS